MEKSGLLLGFLAVLEGCSGCGEKLKLPPPSEHIQKTIEIPQTIRACIEEARQAVGKFGQDGDRLLRCADDIAQTANALARKHHNEPLLVDQIAELFRQGMYIALQASASTSTVQAGRRARELSYEMQQKLLQEEAMHSTRSDLPGISLSPPPPPPSPPEPPHMSLPDDVVRCREYKGNEPRVLWGCARKIAGAAQAYEQWFRKHTRDEYEYWAINIDLLDELTDLYSSATFQAYNGSSAEWDALEASPAYPFVRKMIIPDPDIDNFARDTFDNRWERVSGEHLRTMYKINAWWRCENMHRLPDYKQDAALQFDCAKLMKEEAEKKQKRLTAQSTQWEVSEAARLYHRAGTIAITASELEKDPATSTVMASFASDMAAEWMDLRQRLGQ